jgi:glycosyltransferase involved in cell wall biosynthesis
VAGDGAVLVDPDDVEGMCQSIHRLMQDTEFKKEIVKKGHERARMFSHENAAKQTLDVYQSVCAARRK